MHKQHKVYESSDGRYVVYEDTGRAPPTYHIHDIKTGTVYGNRHTLDDATQDVSAAVQHGGFETPGWDNYWTKKSKGSKSWHREHYGDPKPLKPTEIAKVTDALGKPIDPGIRHAVQMLARCGFTTTSSCEGHVTHGAPTPWIHIFVDSNNTLQRIQHAITNFNRKHNLSDAHKVRAHLGSDDELRIQTMTDAGKPSEVELVSGRTRMNKFVTYLCTPRSTY